MIKELIFSSKKYWQAEDEPLIGKTVIPPKRDIYVTNNVWGNRFDSTSATSPGKPQGIITGYLQSSSDGIVIYTTWLGWFRLNDLLQNGGGIE